MHHQGPYSLLFEESNSYGLYKSPPDVNTYHGNMQSALFQTWKCRRHIAKASVLKLGDQGRHKEQQEIGVFEFVCCIQRKHSSIVKCINSELNTVLSKEN